MAMLIYCFYPSPSLTFNKKQWNKIIKHHVLQGNPHQAILLYTKMLESGYTGDNFTYPALLKASTHFSSSRTMIPLHAQAIKTGFADHVFVETALLTAYAALGYVENAGKLFDKMSNRDLVAWNSMLDIYASAGQMENATKLFNLMPVKDNISFNIMISGYAKIGNVRCAKEYFDKIAVRDIVSWNSMISAYTKAGEVEQGRKLFDRMVERNLVSWNTMITGYLDNKLYTDAINLFFEMREGLEPNHITLGTVLSACAHLGSEKKGREVHIYAGLIGLGTDPRVATALIDMYAKCGNINGALQVFYKSQVKDITCWNAMISGLALHGNACSALKLFEDLQNRNMKPDDITFIGLLTACSHAGLIDEGRHLFESMEKDYGILPKLEHYGCMVDLLGRAGFLQSAYQLIKVMPFQPGVTVYGALLSACVVHRNLEMGKIVAEHIIRKVDSLSDGEYMMLANMYASCGKWEEANRWRQKMNNAGISKTAGHSTIEINGRMLNFVAGDIEQVSLDANSEQI